MVIATFDDEVPLFVFKHAFQVNHVKEVALLAVVGAALGPTTPDDIIHIAPRSAHHNDQGLYLQRKLPKDICILAYLVLKGSILNKFSRALSSEAFLAFISPSVVTARVA